MIDADESFDGLNITFNTTEDCNLACKYCYEINKRKKDLSLDKAYKFIDLILSDEDYLDNQNDENRLTSLDTGIILDFIGGDSFMNVEVVEKILQYFMYKVMTLDTQRAQNYRIHWRCSISTNGTLFTEQKVRDFCEKYKDVLSVGISIDGCKEIHDKNRIFAERGPNGEEIGSMDTILKNWEWFRQVFPYSSRQTKATCSKETIPYLFESLKFMVEDLELYYINQNFIMEDMHLEESDLYELESQMEKCVRYTLDHRYEIFWGLLDKNSYANHKIPELGTSKCGSGCMPCLGINGKIYPCFRWAPHTQTGETRDMMVVGDVWNGFNHRENFKKVRDNSTYEHVSFEERCKDCEYSSACAYCIGGCFAEYGDFKRTTHNCELVKILCKWSKVYWNEFNKLEGLSLEFDEKYQLDRVPKWTPKYIGTNKGD